MIDSIAMTELPLIADPKISIPRDDNGDLAFPCVVVDPPWPVKAGPARTGPGGKGVGRERDLAYPTMTLEEIAALKIPAARDAHLYLWTINRYIRQTYEIAEAWGFESSTMLFWLKQPKGIGLGGIFTPCVEPILFCRRGHLGMKRRLDRNWWSWPRRHHSAKPEEFQAIVESVSPGPYLEMFARRKRPGWAVWGNEVDSDIEVNFHADQGAVGVGK